MPQETSDPRYLYEQIYSALKEEILSGSYHKGDWFPPERVLKDRFATTHLTVRNALAKLVREGYIERYSGKGTVVIYSREHPPVQKPALRFPWAHVILKDLDELNARFLESLDAEMRKLPLPLRVSCHHGDVLLTRGLCDEAHGAGALVILEPPFGNPPPDAITLPAILFRAVDAAAPGPRVGVDDVEGGRQAARHLLSAGHGAIAVIGEPGFGPSELLHRGLIEELSARGLPAEAAILQSSGPGMEGGEPAARAVLRRRPDCRAFLCGSDETAAGVRAGLRGAGPLHVVGYGNTRLARALSLTSIDPMADRLAERVAACIREGVSRGELAAEQHRVVPELVIRATKM